MKLWGAVSVKLTTHFQLSIVVIKLGLLRKKNSTHIGRKGVISTKKLGISNARKDANGLHSKGIAPPRGKVVG